MHRRRARPTTFQLDAGSWKLVAVAARGLHASPELPFLFAKRVEQLFRGVVDHDGGQGGAGHAAHHELGPAHGCRESVPQRNRTTFQIVWISRPYEPVSRTCWHAPGNSFVLEWWRGM